MKGKLYINEFCALNVPTGHHYCHGKGVIKAEKKTKIGHICSHTAPKPVQTLYVLMSAVSRHSVLCVYHASLLTRSYSDG